MTSQLPSTAIFYNPDRPHKRDLYAGYVLLNITYEEGITGPVYKFTEAPMTSPLPSVTFEKDWRWPTLAKNYGTVRVRTKTGRTKKIHIMTLSHHYKPTNVEVFSISPKLWKAILANPSWKRNFTVSNAAELTAKNPPLAEPYFTMEYQPTTEVVVTMEPDPNETPQQGTIQHVTNPAVPPKKKTPPRGDLKPHTAKLLLELATLKHENTCPITLDVLVAGSEDVAVMPCGHIFSRLAIEECFKNLANINTCPACRDGGRPTMI